MVEVRNLTKRYGNHYAVNDLSFHLDSGKIYGFLGPNGAGKSTTMNIMTGYIGATSGDVIIDGHDLMEEPLAARGSVGYLPEIPPLYTDMTVGEYLQTVAELKRVPAAERKYLLQKLMEDLELSTLKNRLIRFLSKGYRQRVGIAQALIGNPKLIILDEPTVGLDPEQVLQIRGLIRQLGKSHTVILSSHILSEIQAVCDEVLIINAGRLVTRGTPEELEQMAFGGNRIELIAEGEQQQLRDILGQFPQILRMEICCEENTKVETCRIRLLLSSGSDIRRDLFFRFADAGCPILEQRRQVLSLEDVFLELTRLEQDDRQERADLSLAGREQEGIR